MHQKTENHLFKLSIHLSVSKSEENYRQIYEKICTGTPQKLSRTILCLVEIVYTTDSFFQNSRFLEIIPHLILIQTVISHMFAYSSRWRRKP